MTWYGKVHVAIPCFVQLQLWSSFRLDWASTTAKTLCKFSTVSVSRMFVAEAKAVAPLVFLKPLIVAAYLPAGSACMTVCTSEHRWQGRGIALYSWYIQQLYCQSNLRA